MTSRIVRPRLHRSPALALACLAGTLVAACDGDPSSPGGEVAPTSLAVAATFSSAAAGGEIDAFDAADAIRIRLASGGDVLFEEVLPFDPTESEHRFPVEVELEEETEVVVEVELRRGTDPLFRGTATLSLSPGANEEAGIPLDPVAAGIVVDDPGGPLTSIGETVELTGEVLFVTGDAANSLELAWTSQDPDIADVVESAPSGTFARAMSDGEARLEASHGSFSETVTVTVALQVVSVEVEPASSQIVVGGSVQLVAHARDALDNELTGRSTSWSSSDPSVATVDSDGLVQGVGGGSAVISATVDGVEGSASVEVEAVAPEVETTGVLNVEFDRAQLRGEVNPNGSATSAWFEFGTDPELSGAATTDEVSLGSGSAPLTVATTVAELDPGATYYFRAVASSELGTARGEIVSFQTLEPQPPSVTTEPATEIGEGGATLNASVNPGGAATEVWFEVATEPDFVEFETTSPVPAGDGGTDVPVSVGVELSAESTYYYRAVASNSLDTSQGDVLNFRTPIPAPSNLQGEFLQGSALSMDFIDNSITNTFFRVERSEESTTSGFEEILTLPGDNDSMMVFFSDTPPAAGNVYYRVFACNEQECSEPSNVLMLGPSISGRVTDDCFSICFGLSDVEVRLTGPTTLTLLTNSAGFFDFDNVLAGTYTVSVHPVECDPPYTFDPDSRQVTVTEAGVTTDVPDFTGMFDTSCPGDR